MGYQIGRTPTRIIISNHLSQLRLTKRESKQLAIEIMQTAIAEGWIDAETLSKMQAVIDEA